MNEATHKLLLVIAAISFFPPGCAGSGNYGTFQRDRDFDKMFLSYQVLPDYKYYTSGGYDKPNAILGIHRDYQLVSELWQSIPDVDSTQIKKWISTIDPEDRGSGHSYFASYILDPEGKQVGFWYSIQKFTVVKFLDENKIEVYTPDLIQPGDEFSSDGNRVGPIILR